MCLPHGLRDLCLTRLGLLALNGYGCGVVDILIESVYNIEWRIVGRPSSPVVGSVIVSDGLLFINEKAV